MTFVKHIALALFALMVLCVPSKIWAQDTLRGNSLQRLAVVDTAVSPRYVYVLTSDCGGLIPYYPDVEYIFVYRDDKLCFPEITRDRYFYGKYWYDWWRLPRAVEVEEVDGVKVIKDESIDDDPR